MIYSNKVYDIGMVELAAVITFTLEGGLESSSLFWSHLCQLDQDGVDLFSRAHGSTLPYAPLPNSSPGTNSGITDSTSGLRLEAAGAGRFPIFSEFQLNTVREHESSFAVDSRDVTSQAKYKYEV